MPALVKQKVQDSIHHHQCRPHLVDSGDCCSDILGDFLAMNGDVRADLLPYITNLGPLINK